MTIIDTGLDTGHPDFAGRPNVALLNQQSPISFDDEFYHGTIVASTVGAAANGVGSVGVYPTSALRIFKLRSLTDPDIIAALDSAATGDVVNLSIGGPGYSRSLYEAIMRAVDRGALVVAAGGNHFGVGNPDIYPADYPHVITVAATDQANQPLFFSSANPRGRSRGAGRRNPDPGSDRPGQLRSRRRNELRRTDRVRGCGLGLDGTSRARPLQIFALLRESATDIGRPGFDTRTGTGLVNLPAALAAKAPTPDPGEPNDDVDLITGKVLAQGDPALTSAGRGSATVRARLDAIEDPRDVYRVLVPAGKTIQITVTPDNPVDVFLWKQNTLSVLGRKSNRLAASTKPGSRTETIVLRNTTRRAITPFVELRIPGGGGGDSAEYTLRVRTG